MFYESRGTCKTWHIDMTCYIYIYIKHLIAINNRQGAKMIFNPRCVFPCVPNRMKWMSYGQRWRKCGTATWRRRSTSCRSCGGSWTAPTRTAASCSIACESLSRRACVWHRPAMWMESCSVVWSRTWRSALVGVWIWLLTTASRSVALIWFLRSVRFTWYHMISQLQQNCITGKQIPKDIKLASQ